MSAVLVDSNVILDVAGEFTPWFNWSKQALTSALNRSRLVINAIVFAEVSIQYSRIEDLAAVMPSDVFRREAIPFEAAFLAGKAHLAYRRLGGTKLTPLPDFFIGAHALVAGYQLLTRDAARYRTYFPALRLITPDK